MKLDDGLNLMMNGLAGFHGNFKKIFGQIALRLNDEAYLTTGDNKPFSTVTREDIVVCDINTGDLGKIFQERSDINVIIFGCNKDIVDASNCGDYFAPALDDLAYITGSSLGIISDASSQSILAGIGNSGMCLVKGIGAFVASDNIKLATTNMLVVEKSCEAYSRGKKIGGVKKMDADLARSLRSNYKSDYLTTNNEPVGYTDQSVEESNVCTNLVKHVAQLGQDDLNYGSWGNVSVRYDDRLMYITPSAMEYDDISTSDIVKIDIETLESTGLRVPSMDTLLHARMYRFLPECNAIIHTHSNACSIFAACEAGFAITDPAMKQMIGDVHVIPYSDDIDELSNSVISTMKNTHAAILAHHGAIFYGPSIEAVYEIAKGVEQMAHNLLKPTSEEDE